MKVLKIFLDLFITDIKYLIRDLLLHYFFYFQSTDHQPQDEKFQKRRTDSASSRVSIQLLNNQIMPALPKLQESQNFHQPPSSRDEENRKPRRHQVVFLSFLRLKQVKPRMKSTAEMMNLMGSNSVISVKINPPLPSENELQVLLELPKVIN